jgi:predicted nucleic acid-binding protein
LINNLPIEQQPVNPNMAKLIGDIKANNSMSFADSCIAGLTKKHNAILVHKDPEFEQIQAEIKLHTLPYKTNNI